MSKMWDRLGQIAVVAGGLDVIVSGGATVLGLATTDQQNMGENAKRLAAATSDVASITTPVALGLPILAALLVVVGVGLLRETPWARKLALVWSGVAIGYLVLMVTVNAVLVWPRIDAAREAAAQSGATLNALVGYGAVKYASLRVALLRLPFPLVLLWRVGRRSAGDPS